MRIFNKKMKVEIENTMRVYLESIRFENEMRVLQKSAVVQLKDIEKIKQLSIPYHFERSAFFVSSHRA